MEVSIRDVASRAGVSISTVSRIMNNSATVSEKKVLAVREAMEYYNYEPNQFARGLKKQVSNMIGVYFPVRGESIFESSYNLELLKGIEKALEYRNYSMVLISENRDYSSRKKRIPRYMEYMRQKRIDGLVLSGLTEQFIMDEAVRDIVDGEYPVVYIGKRIHKRGLNVYAQFEQYMVKMVEILRENGHKKIVLYLADSHRHYLEGIAARARREMPEVELSICLLHSWALDREYLLQNVREYVLQKGYTAICTRGMEDTQVLLSVCAELGIPVPERMSILSVEHRYNAGQFLYPRISSFYVPAQDMGEGAARLLIDSIEKAVTEENSIEYRSEYIERDSVRRL